MAWFWIISARIRRHERDTIRSARKDWMGVSGCSSSRNWSRWRSNSAWLSEEIMFLWDNRPCFVAFWDEASLPSGVFGPVDFFAF